ncbi:MAG: ATP-binding protein [Deltaproteobacteria bacterium]|nr:ATP-binding protein [Deltaproteobacteria bacterium]MBW2012484.1 ATP-binding protein [Deltaproteobacteria bacterium]MBW2088423.1 ATP-binding protein [Deltaproteobacteria bacterium]MBW2319702.1 ATP-binding protein [Deltaproteobacteria bacterium]
MTSDYKENDYAWIKELMHYPQTLEQQLSFFKDTSKIPVPKDPIEQVIFQDKAKRAIRKIAQNKGHILMVGRPGTGKSMLANMFNQVIDKSLGDYLRPKQSIVAYPGKDKNNIRIAYENSEKIDDRIAEITNRIVSVEESMDDFSLSDQINAARKVKKYLLWATGIGVIAGFFFAPAFIATGLTGIGAIFMYMQESNYRVQEKIQNEAFTGKKNAVKHLYDMVPEVLYDPRKDNGLMARISEPDSRNMKGGFRHDPYQSGNLHTPAHKRAYLGAHAKSPIIYIDELKTLIKVGYMSDLLEIMQNKKFILEGGRNTGSGSADRSENHLKADNIIVACCNHDTLEFLQKEGDGAFLSRIEDKGEIIHLESAVPETSKNIEQVVQYVKQEILNLGEEFKDAWEGVIEKEGYEGVRKRSEHIFGKRLPDDYKLKEREFSRDAVLEIIKELRCRASDKKLSSILRPINGIIKTAEFEAILDNAQLVLPEHVRRALDKHLSLEGEISKEMVKHKKDLKKYIGAMTDSIGYVVGLAVNYSKSSGQMFGQPLPIHCQINAGGSDTVVAPGRIGDIAKGAAQNVRASIKKVLQKIGAPYVGYEMHVEYIQAHSGVEGDSASVAMDIAIISDYIKQPVNQKIGVTGSLTGDIILAVGGVTEKIISIMDPVLGMEGACIPWQNKHDIEPLLINTEYEYIQNEEVPGIRIYRVQNKKDPFDIYFCKTKYNAYQILMGLDKQEVETRMTMRSKEDLEFIQRMKGTLPN